MRSYIWSSMEHLRLRAAWGSALSLLITMGSRAVAALGGVAFSLVVAQSGGAVGLGSVTQITACLLIAAMIIKFGTDQSLLVICANFDISGRRRDAMSYLVTALLAGGLISLLVGLSLIMLLRPLGASTYFENLASILIWSLPALTAGQIASACLKGFRYSATAVFAELGAISGITTIVIILTSASSMEAACVMFVYVANITAMLGIGVALTVVVMCPSRGHSLGMGRYNPPTIREFFTSSWPFMLSGLSLLATQSGSFAIGGLELSEAQLGELRTAERLALLIGFAMTAIGPFMAPRIAAAWAIGGSVGARRSYNQAVRASLVFAIPATIAVAALGPAALRVFGPEFTSAYPLLLIMAFGQLAYAALSPLNVVLQTTGHEHQAMLISVITLVLGTVLLWLGSMFWGPMGFASGYSLTILLRGMLAYRVAHKYVLTGVT